MTIQPQKILIVEDEPIWQTNLKSLLGCHAFEVVPAFDYAEALSQIERNHTTFALAIVDLELSSSHSAKNRNGLDVLKKLREKGIYAIVLSIYTDELAAELSQRPEVYDVADKIRFANGDYDDFFIDKVQQALKHAELDRAIEQPFAHTPTYFEKGRALVVGVANYPTLTKLPDIVLKDARDLTHILTDSQRCGYRHGQVKQLLDDQATKESICNGLADLAVKSQPTDTVIVFFSGHGQSGGTQGYILPWDVQEDHLAETAIGKNEMKTMLDKISAERLLVIFDSCHSGGVAQAKTSTKSTDSSQYHLEENYYQMLAQGKGNLVMASCRPDEQSYILEGMSNSLFTHAILSFLKGETSQPSDGHLRVFDLFKHVSTYVPQKAEEIGESQTPLLVGEMENNFPIAIHR